MNKKDNTFLKTTGVTLNMQNISMLTKPARQQGEK